MHDKITLKQSMKDYAVERAQREREAQDYYCALGAYFHWKVDAIYEDKIIDLIGQRGLELLREFKLIEFCGSPYNRRLYVL
jgi:hypothetical protein